jgi:hypothetical protein
MLNNDIHAMKFDHYNSLQTVSAASISAGPTFFIAARNVCACGVFPN